MKTVHPDQHRQSKNLKLDDISKVWTKMHKVMRNNDKFKRKEERKLNRHIREYSKLEKMYEKSQQQSKVAEHNGLKEENYPADGRAKFIYDNREPTP